MRGSYSGFAPSITVSPTEVRWAFFGTPPTFPVTEDVTVHNPGPGDTLDVSGVVL